MIKHIFLFKLAWSIDSLAKKVVGEKQTVALVVQLVVTILNLMTKIERHNVILSTILTAVAVLNPCSDVLSNSDPLSPANFW